MLWANISYKTNRFSNQHNPILHNRDNYYNIVSVFPIFVGVLARLGEPTLRAWPSLAAYKLIHERFREKHFFP